MDPDPPNDQARSAPDAMLQANLGPPQWPQPTGHDRLASGAVHVWRCIVGRDCGAISAAGRVLSADECEKAARFHFEADRTRFVLGRGMLRHVLAQWLHRRPEEIGFEYGAFGKPMLAPGDPTGQPQFNLSHSGDLILLAVTTGRAIGIDVERMRTELPHAGIAEHFFSAAERGSLAGLPASAQAAAFYACWTRKEAFIKATGVGLSLPLDQFDVSLRPGEPAKLLATRPDAAEAHRWTLLELDVGPNYKAAAAIEGTGFQLKTFDWRADARE
jgi:4'-phosphopantetheinyl transferase